MKKKQRLLISLFSVLVLCMIGGQTVQADGTASNGSKAGITLKIKEDPPTTSEPAPEPTPSEPTKELPNVPIEESTPSGKGIVNGSKLLPSMGELAGNIWWISLGLVLILGVIYQVKRCRK